MGIFCFFFGQELTLSTRQNCKNDEFIVKRLKDFNVFLLIKPTRAQSHIFGSLMIPKSEVKELCDSTVFRSVEDCGNCLITGFSSMSKSKLVNWVNAEATFVTMMGVFCE